MRRLLLSAGAAGTLAAGIAGGLALTPAHAGGDYRVDVIFDDARGLIPGQLVQIAGARVGEIDDVTLTPDFKARVQMHVKSQFAPFRKDATCTIRPQGLIAENYVDCVPGSPDAPALKGVGDQAPTVPLSHTTAPVQVTDLFDIWQAPVRDRLTLLVDALGIGTAGRGEDFNAVLRRANPSLALARRVIATLRSQKTQLATILDRTDDVAGALAVGGDRVRAFLDEAAQTTDTTGRRNRQIAETVRRLPGLLAAAEPALRDLDSVVRTGTPFARQIRRAAPDINRLTADLTPFARQVRPTLTQLGPVLAQGTRTLTNAAPVARLLRSYTKNSLPAAQLAGTLFTSLRDKGFVENFLTVLYRGAAATARFDDVGHVFPAFVKLNTCILPATTTNPDCNANFTTTAARTAPASRKRTARRPATTTTPPSASAPAAPTTTQPSAPAPLLGGDPVQTVKDVLDTVLSPIRKPPGERQQDRGEGLGGLLGYLLG